MVLGKLTQISKPILWFSFFFGLILSWSVLSGDSLGRVNLLYLIILYVIFPCSSLVYSFMSYFYSPFQLGSLSTLVISFIQKNNIIFTKYKQQYLMLPQTESPKLTLFYFSQLAAMSFSLASLLVLFILLVATDVHFIWRSTLLSSEQILNILQLIATPWQLWNEAQPNLDLISISQDNRLINEISNQSNVASNNWWKFILATQLFYAFLLRFVVVIIIRTNLKLKQIKNTTTKLNNIFDLRNDKTNKTNKTNSESGFDLCANDIKIDYALNNWANISLPLLNEIKLNLVGQCINVFNAGPSGTDSERIIAERWRETQLIIVKSWEPPLAELSDFMQNSIGYILPLDIKNDEIVKAVEFHLQEWTRFVGKHPQWDILLLPNLSKSSEEILEQTLEDTLEESTKVSEVQRDE
jgi:hypothetical protein